MATGWYILIEGESVGPVPPTALVEMARSGAIYPHTKVKRGINGKWMSAKRVKTLFPEDNGQCAQQPGIGAPQQLQDSQFCTPDTSAGPNVVAIQKWACIAVGIGMMAATPFLGGAGLASLFLGATVAAFGVALRPIMRHFLEASEEEHKRLLKLREKENDRLLELREKEKNRKRENDSRIVCPHCHTAGHVTTTAVTLAKGVSGGKATAAVLTGGWSLLVTGLSRKEDATKAQCSHCGSTWHF